jgi:molybdopterin/thiamine biosynthesis adenylyltransferase
MVAKPAADGISGGLHQQECPVSTITSNGLSVEDRTRYEWQIPVAGFGETGQAKLKAASVLISRCGGLGGVVACELAAAGVGRLILAHGGQVKLSDLNRQILMTHAGIGKPRIESVVQRLREFNPRIELVGEPDNVNESNAERLAEQADVIIDCAPLFEERYLMNQQAVRLRKPMVECAVFELEAHLTTIVPGQTPCLRCLYPEQSPVWTRKFPVFGAVSGAVGCLAAMEAIKLIAGFGSPLLGQLLVCDLRDMNFHKYCIQRNPHCPECSGLSAEAK